MLLLNWQLDDFDKAGFTIVSHELNEIHLLNLLRDFVRSILQFTDSVDNHSSGLFEMAGYDSTLLLIYMWLSVKIGICW